MEDDRLHMHTITLRPGGGGTSPPAIHLSPTRQSSSSTDASGVQNPVSSNIAGLTVARKKRELFSSARSSRSGGSNKSSDASIEYQSSSSTKVNTDIYFVCLSKY